MLTRNKFAFLLVFLTLLLALVFPTHITKADTGTFTINHYVIDWAFNSDGSINAHYHQEWTVNTGHADWITVGLPNSSFKILGSSGNIKSISSANQGTWSGVRLDLDRDYQPGNTFSVDFDVALLKMLYVNPNDKNINIQFTPGWYDNIPISDLTINVHQPPTGFLKLEPNVTVRDGVATWSTSLNAGGKYAITSIVLVPSTFSSYQDNIASSGGGGIDWVAVIIIGAVVLLVLFVIMAAFLEGDGYGSGGGSTVFFGGGSSCASCAGCASCACACACAGGGGAGCKDKNAPRNAVRMNLETFITNSEVKDASKRPPV